MIEEPQIVESVAQPIAVLRLTVPRAEIQNVMGPGYQELLAAVAAQGVTPTGPWFTHHLRMDPAVFDFEIGVPVASEIAAAGRVKPSAWPALTMARTTYRGPYEGLGDAWGRFEAWIAAAEHTPAPDLWERYVAGPESSADPSQWRTELSRPLLALRIR